MTLTLKFADTFTGANNTALGSHTPDTDVPGSGWNVWNGAIRLQGNAVEDNNGSSGNRANVGAAFGTIDYDVILNVGTWVGGATSTRAPGVGARHTSATAADGIEFYHGGGTWYLDDNTTPANNATAAEALTSPLPPMKLECRGATVTGYAYQGGVWVQKCQITAASTTGTRKYTSLVLVNFSTTPNTVGADGYEVYEYTSAVGAVRRHGVVSSQRRAKVAAPRRPITIFAGPPIVSGTAPVIPIGPTPDGGGTFGRRRIAALRKLGHSIHDKRA